MSYQVIARKWRPQKFEEVVFQDHVSRTLQNSIKKGRISHAYLFSGPRGVGKTSLARILAKALNCSEGPTATPCGKCENCLEIKNGTSFDVIEIDGASNNSVDDIRELRENVNFAPVKSTYKVYIIDEVHMVTTQAFNALLKTLEEPPPHIIFIFATTEYHKIPETILSRCQKYFFKKIPVERVVEHLRYIVEKEGYHISDTALFPVARASEGSMRDAQSLLDQVISFASGEDTDEYEISEKDALSVLGIMPLESYISQLRNIASTDAAAAMNEVERLVTMGIDIPRYINGFIGTLRSVRLLKNGITLQNILGLSPDEENVIREITELFYDEELARIFRIADLLHNELRYAADGRINLEMALLDMISVKKSPSISSILKKIGSSGGGAGTSSASGSGKNSAPDHVISGNELQKKKYEPGDSQINIKHAWKDFLASIKNERQYLHFILEEAAVFLEDDVLHLGFPGGADNLYYGRMLGREDLVAVKNGISDKIGKKIEITIDKKVSVYSEDGDKSAKKVSASGTYGDSAGIQPVADSLNIKAQETVTDENSNPTVAKIIDIFHGQLIQKGE